MTTAITTLALPRISPRVAVQLTVERNGGHELASLFAEREALGLPTIYPDHRVHATIDDAVLANLHALGYQPNAYSENHFQICCNVINEGFEPEDGDQLLSNFVVDLPQKRISLHQPILALEAACAGLGETLMHWLNKVDHKAAIPGFVKGGDVLQLYTDYRLESAETDEEAFEHMVAMGYEDEDDIRAMVPSAVRASLGGDIFLKPKRKLTLRELPAQLKKAGFKNAERLLQLLRKELPARCQVANKAIHSGPIHRWRWDGFAVLITGESEQYAPHVINGFLDELENDHNNNGESTDLLFVQRVELNFNNTALAPPHKDGLAVLAHLFNAWTSLDEVLTLLLDYTGAETQETTCT